jgi:hypothetical protein
MGAIMEGKDESKARAAKARAEALSPERRSEIASEAAKARWADVGPDLRTQDHLVIYTNARGAQTDLRFTGDTLWATQRQMAEMFDVTVANVNIHLSKIFRERELEREAVIKRDLITAADGKAYPTMLYELEAIISLGMRVSSTKGTHFRIWARKILKEFLVKGFVIHTERLKNPDGRPDFFDELMARIRDIRSSEKRMWTRVLELASFCTDFHGMDERHIENFFATIQNAMHWAVTQETAAEVIYHRVDSSKGDAGVMHFKGEAPTAEEAKVAKNYYAEGEINALNILTSATLEFFESQAEQRRPTTLAQFLEKMRDFIKLDGRPLIPSGHLGKISMKLAKEKAALEMAIYRERIRLEKEAAGERAVADLLSQARTIATNKRAKRKARDSQKG